MRLAARGARRPELPPERAGDVLGLLASISIYRQLIDDYGWTFDECEAWIRSTLETLLLREDA
jgi:hypothetical protein